MAKLLDYIQQVCFVMFKAECTDSLHFLPEAELKMLCIPFISFLHSCGLYTKETRNDVIGMKTLQCILQTEIELCFFYRALLSPWDGLIALQLFTTCYAIVGIPTVHCSQLRAYSNQQPLTQVEYVLHPGQICLFVF